MIYKSILRFTIPLFFISYLVSCTKDLNRVPYVQQTSASVYEKPENYKLVLAKLYASYAISGQQGPFGNPDIAGIDEGFGNYLRQYFNLQQLTTDETIIAWNDGDVADLHSMKWSSNNTFITAMYNRIFYTISLCNELIRQSSDEVLSQKRFSAVDVTNIKTYVAEAVFLRALSYTHALDMFGNVPFVTDSNTVGSFRPKQIQRKALFEFIEKELLRIENVLPATNAAEYGRVNKAAVQSLLARLYLNAKVYTGTERYTDCINYCKKVIQSGVYQLESDYTNLFRADNHLSKELIFSFQADGRYTQGYGGMNYLIHAQVGGNMNAADYGINGGWAGLRVTKGFVNQFSDPSGSTDKRALFHTSGQNIDITDVFKFTDGYAIRKFSNLTSAGSQGSDNTGNFVDTDFPVFRLAEIYLMYAEAVLNGGAGGSMSDALSYVNMVRSRAYGGSGGTIQMQDLNNDFILAERAREFYWEGHRRTDLIRFNKFTGSEYLWPWKGGVAEGIAVQSFRSLYPIPAADITANPNLKQNTGY